MLASGSAADSQGAGFEPRESRGAAATDWLPNYERLGEIHRGGQGVVYRALQQSTRRIVAVKVLRHRLLATRADRVRFDREIEILAGLNHPGIVTIHDSGQVEGLAYYVMDFVEGRPLDQALTALADRGDLPGLLSLYAEVCDAVHAAHLRGVIHRDLKPSNILVDAAGRPHILDFGLAKWTIESSAGGEVGGAVAMTQTGQFVGSLPWASPEQAEGADVDVRTDVYSLGVMLYQALSGRFPYRIGGPLREVLDRIVREPAPPLARRGARGVRIAADLDTIARKCLEKSAERRYQSAGELARDVRNFLAARPIDARRDSALYVLRKSLRRWRVPVAVAAAFFVLSIASAAALSVMYGRQLAATRRAETHEREAVRLRDEARDSAVLAARERDRAEHNAEEALEKFHLARDTAEFVLDQLSEKLRRVPGTVEMRQTLLRSAYGRFTALLTERSDDPRLALDYARSHLLLGDIARDMGELPRAREHLETAAERMECLRLDGPPERATEEQLSSTLILLGDLALREGREEDADRHYSRQYALAEALQRDWPFEPSAVRALSLGCERLGRLAQRRGERSAAISWMRQMHDLKAAWIILEPERALAVIEYTIAKDALGDLYWNDGQRESAARLYAEALRIRQMLYPDPPSDVSVSSSFAASYERAALVALTNGRLGESREWADKTYAIKRRLATLDPRNRDYQADLVTAITRLARLDVLEGDNPRAYERFGEAVQLGRELAAAEPGNPSYCVTVGSCLANLANLHFDEGRDGDGCAIGREAIALAERGPKDWELDSDIAAEFRKLRERLATCEPRAGG